MIAIDGKLRYVMKATENVMTGEGRVYGKRRITVWRQCSAVAAPDDAR